MDWWAPGATVLVVPVPEAEPAVGPLRRLHSPSGRDGLPAHVTLLAPLAGRAELERNHAAELRGIAAACPAFAFRLARFGRFPSALYLAPEPASPFARLAGRLRDAIPAQPLPPGGMIPHLTIASRVESERLLDELESLVAPSLPIEARATEIALYEREPDLTLRAVASFPLGGPG